MIQIGNETWLSTAEVLDTLKISRSTLWSMRRAGTFIGNVKLGRCLYYSAAKLAEFMHEAEQSC
jgi:predicted DNA-binding transcriptional regulator AlpA